MVRYEYRDLKDKTKIPDNCTEFRCYNLNLTELPVLPNSLIELVCHNNNLTSLPELPITLVILDCSHNNIKYLSPNNCEVMKKCEWFEILNNPFSAIFTGNYDFKEYLMNL